MNASLKPPSFTTAPKRSSIWGRISAWRARRRASPAWTVAVAVIFALALLPVAAIAVLAISPTENIWPHLLSTVLPRAFFETVTLMAGVAALTLIVGAGTAWLVTMYRFPARGLVDWLLVVPLAMPTYIIAFCYVELLDYSGSLQSGLRAFFGWHSMRDYWFPEIRSLGGTIFVMSAVLYPYVYLSARASFVQQSVCTLEVARTLGRTPIQTFWSVALPLARPALVAGAALALMECLNDIGAVQLLGVRTLTSSVYTTWLERSNLGGAAQIAGVMLIMVLAIFAVERRARGAQRFHHTTGRFRAIAFSDLEGWRGGLAALVCLLPFVLGFVLPVATLVGNAVRFAPEALTGNYASSAINSVLLAVLAAFVAVLVGLVLAYARRVAPNGFIMPAVRLSGLGYAVPGTVLALGLLIPLAALDNMIDGIARSSFGISTGLLMTGGVTVLVLAYTIRFLAVSLGSLEAGFERLSPNLDAVSRTLGQTAMSTLARVHLPLLVPALAAGGLLVFVETMKELPATLLLRPFNFDTLATHVYGLASFEQYEEAAVAALTIVGIGLVPVLLLHRALAGGRAGYQR